MMKAFFKNAKKNNFFWHTQGPFLSKMEFSSKFCSHQFFSYDMINSKTNINEPNFKKTN